MDDAASNNLIPHYSLLVRPSLLRLASPGDTRFVCRCRRSCFSSVQQSGSNPPHAHSHSHTD
ncbi:uncharacterized protein V6R79_019602 [Siganus canaliculatus]